METDLGERIAELEARVVFQDQTISQLNDVIIELRGQIDRVERVASRLMDRVQQSDTLDGSFDSEDQKPPHY